ncbi:MAG: hypothetical protein K2G19_01945, partial [Lachnospiraceae bacterium]|nr:hypothetical protein [Lachnospiraceae bacterium]
MRENRKIKICMIAAGIFILLALPVYTQMRDEAARQRKREISLDISLEQEQASEDGREGETLASEGRAVEGQSGNERQEYAKARTGQQ